MKASPLRLPKVTILGSLADETRILAEHVREKASPDRALSILEAGCGLARFTVGAHARGYRAEGVDYAPEVIARLQNRFPDIPFFAGDVRALDVPDEAYDAVYSPGVCEHFEEGPEAVLEEAHRVCRRRGIVLVSTPCFNRLRRWLARGGAFAEPPHGHFYQYAFSPREMTAILERIGFDVVEVSQRSSLYTLESHFPRLRQVPLGRLHAPMAVLIDQVPGLRSFGHGCLWVAKKR